MDGSNSSVEISDAKCAVPTTEAATLRGGAPHHGRPARRFRTGGKGSQVQILGAWCASCGKSTDAEGGAATPI